MPTYQPPLHPGGFFSLEDLEAVHREKFGRVPRKRLIRNLFRLRKILKDSRKDAVKEDDLVKALSTVVGLAQSFRISLAEAYPKYYFSVCRYCTGAPCWCSSLIKKPQKKLVPMELFAFKRGVTLAEIQVVDWKVYPNNLGSMVLRERALHMTEEILEILEEVYEKTEVNKSKLEEELSDLFERVLSFASTRGFWAFSKSVALFYNRLKEGSNFFN